MTPRAAEAVLRQVLDRCKRLQERPGLEEADLREALYWLKLASDLTDPVFIIEGTAVDHPLLSEMMQLMAALMKPLKSLNPALTNWERAVDAKYAIVTRTSRRGVAPVREFNPAGVRKDFEAVTGRILREIHGSGEPSRAEMVESGRRPQNPAESHPREEVQTGTVRRSPVPMPRAPSAIEEPPPLGAISPAEFSVPPPRDRAIGEPPRPGDFLMRPSDGERLSAPGTGRDRYQGGETSDDYYSAPARRRRVRGRRETRYGHQEDDMAFFAQQFNDKKLVAMTIGIVA